MKNEKLLFSWHPMGNNPFEKEYTGYDPSGDKIIDKWIDKKRYTYVFECPNISKLRLKWEKDEIYNKVLDQFQEQLKDWIYK